MVGGRTTLGHGNRSVMQRHNPVHKYIVSVIAVAVAALFIYAGIEKLQDPQHFADSIAAFAILPAVLINVVAFTLPPFEIACGVLLLVPRTRRIGALAVALVCVVFFSALISALLRGLTLDCGCFGSSAPSRPRMWIELGLDVLLFVSAALVYFCPGVNLSRRAS